MNHRTGSLPAGALPIGIALLAVLDAFACRPAASSADPGRGAASSTDARASALYYCPMHTDYRSDRPGNCPICNMMLVPLPGKTGDSTPEIVSGHAPAAIPVELQQRIGLATSIVEKKPFTRILRSAGRVEIAERSLSAVSLRYGGWIEDLRVRAVGDAVRPGDTLFSIYSPELYEAQRTYLAVRGALGEGDEASKSARQRLLLWDMTEGQIHDLEARGEPGTATAVFAKAEGSVIRREAQLGMRVEPGATLYEIADLRELWVIADVYEQDIPLLKLGAEASIELASSPGVRTPARIAYINPTLSEATRTARVRIEVANPDGRLRPGEYATVSIAADLGEQLLVDVDAVIDTGTRKIAFVDAGEGRFDPREVTLGARSEGRAVVLSGLVAGERVVSSATFLVDSESRLKSALRMHAQSAQEPAGHAGADGHGDHGGHGGR